LSRCPVRQFPREPGQPLAEAEHPVTEVLDPEVPWCPHVS
jgi:hypothetical protein